MKFARLWILCCLFAATVVSSATPASAAPQPPITEITLADSPGYVASPYSIYRLLLRADGSATQVSGTNEKPLRSYGRIDAADFQRLTALFDSQKFFQMPAYYALVPDGGSALIGAVRAGQRKSVAGYFSAAPLSFWTLEMAIRGVASQIRWYTANPRTVSGVRGRAIFLTTGSSVSRGSNARVIKPMPDTTLIEQTMDGKEIARAIAGSEGNFKIGLLPGSYVMLSKNNDTPKTGSFALQTRREFFVNSDQWTHIDLYVPIP